MANSKTLLIVDDDAGWRDLCAAVARALGYSVMQATDGSTGVAQACASPPDLVLMDLLMPRMDGCKATATLKANLSTKNIPVVVCTALSRSSQTESALAAGAAEVLHKPIAMSAIRAMLQRYAPITDKEAQITKPRVA